jgi:hypothetical protein
VLFGVTAAILYAPSAFAATYTVDNGTDATGQFCTTMGVGDCSLRSAIEHSNASVGTTDTINFEPLEYNGSVTANLSTSGMTIEDGVNIIGGDNCGPSGGVKPCVGVDNTSGSNTFEVAANGVSISGLAFTGANEAINGTGFSNMTVRGSWFGVGLDGTIDANAGGVSTGSGANGDVIGGTSAADRNVFAKNTDTAITTVTGGNNTIEGNYIGTMPDGSAATSPGTTGIMVSGSANGDTIGGDATNAGSCDGACNLIVGLSGTAVSVGQGGPGPTNTKVYGNFIGLGLNGTADQGNGGSGVSAVQASSTTIGAAANTKRNYIAGNNGGGISTSQSDGVNIVNNYIGVNAAGTSSIKNTTIAVALGSGILFVGDGGSIEDNHLGGNGITVIAQPNGGTSIQGNLVGVGPSGQAFSITGESGLGITGGSGYQIGGTGAGEGNTIGNVTTVGDGGPGGPAGIFLTGGSSGDTIQGNFIGTTSTGIPEPDAGWGILLGGSNGYTGAVIGGSDSASENVVSNSGHDAISFNQGGGGVKVLRNVGKNNGTGAGDLFFDISGNGQGNPNNGFANNGIQAPAGLSATSTALSGTGDDGDAIFVYTTYTSHGDIRASLGSTVVASGTWSITLPSLPAGQCVTANQTDGSNNSSEMATAVAVGGGSCVLHPTTEIATGPAEGTSTADPTPTFGFSSPESGVTFQCKMDADAFSSCSGGFTPSTDLPDGLHTFTVRGLQTPSNPGLGPDIGTPVIRTFTVDTTGPVISFISGPGQGATIDTSTAGFGFSANEPATFECSLDAGPLSSCHSPFTVSSLSVGGHTVQILGTDALGNVGASTTRSFSVQLPVPAPPAPPAGPTGQRAAALKKCKKKKSAKARNKCKAKAKKLPV